MQSDQINELMGALNRAQLAMMKAKKETENPFFHRKYADLETVWDALVPFRTEGIVFTQSPQDSPDGYVVLDTQFTHAASGQWIRSRLKMRVSKDDPQGYGSAITYARRYALGAMSGLVTEEDDDANAATGHTVINQKRTAQAKIQELRQEQPQDGLNGAASKDVPPPPVSQDAAAPSPSFIWRIGKEHKDESIATIDGNYLDWFVKNGKNAQHVEEATLELDRRRGQGTLG